MRSDWHRRRQDRNDQSMSAHSLKPRRAPLRLCIDQTWLKVLTCHDYITLLLASDMILTHCISYLKGFACKLSPEFFQSNWQSKSCRKLKDVSTCSRLWARATGICQGAGRGVQQVPTVTSSSMTGTNWFFTQGHRRALSKWGKHTKNTKEKHAKLARFLVDATREPCWWTPVMGPLPLL